MDGTSGVFLGSVYSTLQFRTGGFTGEVAGAQRELRGLGNSFTQAENQSSGFSNALGGAVHTGLLATGAAAVAAGGASIKMAGNFEQSQNILRSVTNATAAEMTILSAKARELGQDITLPGISATDAATAMTELGKAGLNVNDILGASKGVLSLAKAGQIDVAAAATTTARALNAFGLAGTEANRIADLLAAAANASTASVGDMAFGLQMAGAGSKQMGVSLQDTIAALALFSNAGINGSDAGTSLKTMFMALSRPTEESSKLMKQLGLDFFDARGNFVGLESTASQLQSRLGKLNAEQRNAALAVIFGADASRVAGILADKGGQGFEKMAQAVNKQGAAADLAKAQNSGFNGAVDNLIGTLQTAGTDLGTKVLPPLTDFAVLLAGQVNPTIDFATRNGTELVTVIGLLGGAFAAVRIAGFASDLKAASDTLGFFIGNKNATGIRTIRDGVIDVGGAAKTAGTKIADIAVSAAGVATEVSKKGATSAGGWAVGASSAVSSWVKALATTVSSAAAAAVKVSVSGIAAGAGWIASAARVSAAWLLHFTITQGAAVLAGIKVASPGTYAAIMWVANAVKVSIAWTLHFARVVGLAVLTGARVSVQALVASAGWVANAVLVSAAWLWHLARTAASAIATAAVVSGQAVVAAALWLARPAQIALAWALGMGRAGASSIASAAVIAAQATVAAAAHVRAAAVASGAWLVGMAKNIPFAIGWAIGMSAQAVIVGGRYVAAAAVATAAWIVANAAMLGVVGLIVAAVAAGVYLIVRNWDTIRTFFVRLPGQILGALSGLGNSLYGLGRSMIQGLLNGAGSLLGSVGRFFLDRLPGWIVGPFKKALGISSPSRVFAGYGANVVEGLASGIASSRGLVSRAMNGLDAQMTVTPTRPRLNLPSQRGLFSDSPQAESATRGGTSVTIEKYEVNNNIDPERVIRDLSRRVALA